MILSTRRRRRKEKRAHSSRVFCVNIMYERGRSNGGGSAGARVTGRGSWRERVALGSKFCRLLDYVKNGSGLPVFINLRISETPKHQGTNIPMSVVHPEVEEPYM